MTGVYASEAQEGRIPFRLWIGVTGHRHLPNPDVLSGLVGQALERIRRAVPSTAHTEVLLGVISALAEGADRLVVREVLKDSRATLEVPLPLPKDDYMSDFETEESKREFEALLDRAVAVTDPTPTDSRDTAYASAGTEVVKRCDILIALWDGQPARGHGGTAEIVESAKDQVPVLWISTTGDEEIRELGSVDLQLGTFWALDRYNRAHVSSRRVARELGEQEHHLLNADAVTIDSLSLRTFASWVVPYLVWADQAALHYQKWFRGLLYGIVGAALGTVTAVALGATFYRDERWPAWGEFVQLGVVLVIVSIGRLMHLHDRWISARFLAERFRSAFFLAVAGVRRGPGSLERGTTPSGEANLEWVGRAFTEVWSRQPSRQSDPELSHLRAFLAAAWIDEQGDYHLRRSAEYERRHRGFERIIVGLFLLTMIAAFLHGLGRPGGENWESLFVVLAVSLPALAGAFGAIEIEREYRRNAHRYEATAKRLDDAKKQMASATDNATVRALAMEMEELMKTENRDWYAVMEFHDFEPTV